MIKPEEIDLRKKNAPRKASISSPPGPGKSLSMDSEVRVFNVKDRIKILETMIHLCHFHKKYLKRVRLDYQIANEVRLSHSVLKKKYVISITAVCIFLIVDSANTIRQASRRGQMVFIEKAHVVWFLSLDHGVRQAL